ncbi:HAMP domain-containing protein [Photobacterium phosphoreum]|uniref:histidine kinase n=3 Tax=Photobacterium phosphoreum TaxID=659 RepID=A0AAW4ZWY5_PHOPO|nr:histidine kinase sensor domain-containing protein [Photobacterium phosphoreum]MCD9463814.1 two-component sensor histidine kinase [Photobacterium phosphoreum]MCD9471604.1 two-component sensor histidine kinase [Photobacterium phosphoreum]MCD9475281.1 HAMP domain-containing protein [Photobacterium phosphoreum]MCD9478518.1 HAMP domain-containing protein [Photobacterium phosphoreum]MCD9483516.1 HAMP domain-containing protein [Photobacterium phosphoreum]
MLQVPKKVQQNMLVMAEQAQQLIDTGNKQQLGQWEQQQPYYLFVLDKEQHEMGDRKMHPHFAFKLNYARGINTLLDSRVNQPIFAIPLKDGNQLMVQLPSQLHPAKYFSFYFGLIQVVIAVLILLMFSFLIARYLQRPLNTLREASRSLANGDFSVRVANAVSDSTVEFKSLATDFDEMAEQIQMLSERQRRLIRDVSHELRTPLARHNLSLHLMRKRVAPEHQHLVDRLERESEEMNQLVNEILEFNQLQNTTENVNLIPLDVESLCLATVPDIETLLGKQQTLTTAIDNNMPLVMGDSRLIVRAVNNLLGNAMKYAGEQAHIQLISALVVIEGQAFVQLSVEDDGHGIAEQHLKRIFDPFTRIEGARDKQSGGYGLGLAIVKEAMAVMHGAVNAENRQPQGLSIQLLLPVMNK